MFKATSWTSLPLQDREAIKQIILGLRKCSHSGLQVGYEPVGMGGKLDGSRLVLNCTGNGDESLNP